MSFSFSSLIRLIVLMAVGSTMLAVGLSRLDPPQPGWRARRPASHMFINEYFLGVADRMPRWLDVDTGQVASYSLEDGDVLESATCAPWVDEKGDRQVVGRWASLSKDGPMSTSSDFGLARYTFPGGKMIDHVSTETVPAGRPCWFPGTVAKVLFVAGDGVLYRYDFEPEPWIKAASPEAKRNPKPRPVTWRCAKPGNGAIFLSDLTWPDDPRMGGCIVAVLRDQGVLSKSLKAFSQSRLWWLKLNFAGTEVVDCGRLILPDGDRLPDTFEERSPTVGLLANGRLVVAYLQQRVGKSAWELRVAPIEFDADRRTPEAHALESRVLAERCRPAHPSFSSDGRWINVISGSNPSESRITRVSTSKLVEPAR